MTKSPTGIVGFDDITGGGLPAGRTTLVDGGAGSGKTVFALQTLAHGARALGEPAIFVAFEENSRRIAANARTFGWNLESLEGERLFFLDAQPDPDLIQSGELDVAGLLAALGAKAQAMGAKRIAFDAIDLVLSLMSSPAAMRREIYRLHDWLLERELTALITSKSVHGSGQLSSLPPVDFMHFMVDCAIELDHDLVDGVSQRSLRVSKYRGSSFEENAMPFVIGEAGIEVAFVHGRGHPDMPASSERVSSGIEPLDRMLGGGFFKGASILLTGSPGTAKTTLCGAFAEATCRRGEKTLFVSFDSHGDEIVRNLDSVSIRLGPSLDSGLLRLASMRALSGSAENHLMRIKAMARGHGARCLVADPLSALSKAGNRGTAPGVAERLIDWAKAEGMTVMCTSLLEEGVEPTEGTPLQVSTIADTWIHLNYVVHAGERNRGLSIIKSRGTGHSNQVRELVLRDDGVTLADVYTAGGEVLMGTLRWAREREEELAVREREREAARERARLQADAAELGSRIEVLQRQLEAKRLEEAALLDRTSERADDTARTRTRLHERRSAGSSRSSEGDRE